MRILICNDGTDNSNGIIEDLREAGLGDHCDAYVLTVDESIVSETDRSPDDRTAGSFIQKLADTFPKWNVSNLTAAGIASREILAAAKELNVDMIVVGEPVNGSDRQHIFLGQTSGKVVNEAHCSVRVSRVPRFLNDGCVIVAYDGSRASVAAVEQVAARSWPAGTKVSLVVVADSFLLDIVGRFAPQMNNMVVETKFVSQWASTLADSSINRLKAAGVTVTIDIKSGRPQSGIINAAQELRAKCIFVGPHNDPDSFARFVVGSVSESVAKHADCSVEIVRTK